MKLYATTTSERASKGQGGNRYIEYRLNVGSREDSLPVLYMKVTARDEGYHLELETINQDEKHTLDILLKGKK